MRRIMVVVSLVLAVLGVSVCSAEEGLVANWSFDDVRMERVEVEVVRGQTFVPREKLSYVTEKVSGEEHELFAKYYEVVDGVKGTAVLLDGYTAYIEVPAADTFKYRVTGNFSVEAWVALGAYPKHWCPILDHQRDVADGYFNGFFFGVDAMGRLMLRIASNGRNEVLYSSDRIQLNEWTHVAGVYEDNELRVYINGEE
ncbi:MAG: LamG domain-containing protein, partial [Planctomycetota bacterium]